MRDVAVDGLAVVVVLPRRRELPPGPGPLLLLVLFALRLRRGRRPQTPLRPPPSSHELRCARPRPRRRRAQRRRRRHFRGCGGGGWMEVGGPVPAAGSRRGAWRLAGTRKCDEQRRRRRGVEMSDVVRGEAWACGALSVNPGCAVCLLRAAWYQQCAQHRLLFVWERVFRNNAMQHVHAQHCLSGPSKCALRFVLLHFSQLCSHFSPLFQPIILFRLNLLGLV